MFAFAEGDFHFDEGVFEIELQGDEGIALFAYFSRDFCDFLLMQKELAGATGIFLRERARFARFPK